MGPYVIWSLCISVHGTHSWVVLYRMTRESYQYSILEMNPCLVNKFFHLTLARMNLRSSTNRTAILFLMGEKQEDISAQPLN